MLKGLNKPKFHNDVICGTIVAKNCKIYPKNSKLTGISLEMSSIYPELYATNVKFQLRRQSRLGFL